MIAADTSVWLDFARGTDTGKSRVLEAALTEGTLVMPLPVLYEMMSGPGITADAEKALLRLPKLEVIDGYWERAGNLRRKLLKRGHKARAMDCLIAQLCIDHGVALIAADRDYRHFVKDGLKLV